MNILGIDLGGTKIALAKYDSFSWNMLEKTQVETKSNQGIEVVIQQLISLIRSHSDKETEAIGIGVPGPTINGIIEKLPNIPGSKNIDLKSKLEKANKIPVNIENDANCFIVGAWKKGKHKHKQNILGLTLGTGVGGAIIINGKLIRGESGAAGEFGHNIIRDHLSLEDLVSGTALARRWEERFHETKNGQEIVKTAERKDKKAITFLENIGKDLGQALANLIMTFNPEAILIGGSAAAALPFYRESIKRELSKYNFPSSTNIPIENSQNDNFATFGAAWLAK